MWLIIILLVRHMFNCATFPGLLQNIFSLVYGSLGLIALISVLCITRILFLFVVSSVIERKKMFRSTTQRTKATQEFIRDKTIKSIVQSQGNPEHDTIYETTYEVPLPALS